MKIKIIRTILFYLGILIFSYSIYLKNKKKKRIGFIGIMLMASIKYLWMEYSGFEK